MIVVMEEQASDAQVQRVVAHLIAMGFDIHRSNAGLRTVIGAVGTAQGDSRLIELLDGVQEVIRISEPYKLASRTFKRDDTVIAVDDVRIGGDEVIVMAGPCSAENEAQVNAYRSGKEGLLGFFVGQVMRELQGKANAKVVNERVRQKLET